MQTQSGLHCIASSIFLLSFAFSLCNSTFSTGRRRLRERSMTIRSVTIRQPRFEATTALVKLTSEPIR